MNSREHLEAVAEWLGWQDESMSQGLRHPFDALRLYDYAQARPDKLGEMADEWEPEDLIAALGYNPFEEREAVVGRDVVASGATAAFDAMKLARNLIDSVAYIAVEGDKDAVLEALDAFVATEPQEALGEAEHQRP